MADNLPPPPPSTPPPAPEPKKGKADRVPLPLLSRAKLRQPRDIPAVDDPNRPRAEAAAATAAAGPRRKRKTAAAILGRLVAYGALVGLGVGAVHFFRQTQVQGLVAAPGYTLPSEAYLIRDFSDDVRTLRAEAKMAVEPYEHDVASKEESLRRVESDLTDLDQRRALLAADAAQAQDEIKGVLAETRAEADQVWKRDGGALDAEYDAKLSAFRKDLLDRAKGLGIPLELDPAAKSADVWVNGFRLALYNPPPKVKTPPEREWAEKQLTAWHDYEKAFDERRGTLKVKADGLRKGISVKVQGVQDRIAKDTRDSEDAASTAEPLKTERDTLQGEAAGARERLSTQRASYAAQLFEIPKRNVLEKFPLSDKGRFSWEHLDQNPKYPPGSYYLWVSLKKDGREYWTLVPFPVKEYSRTDLVLTPGAFQPVDGLLK